MPDASSRYARVEVATTSIPDGVGGRRQVRYRRRRLLPRRGAFTALTEHVVARGDRLDVVTATYLGDPTQFWRVCDANLATVPDDLTAAERIGERLIIPLPQA